MLENNRFDQRLASIPAGIWSKIAQIDELKGQWIAGARLAPQVLGRLKRSVLITSFRKVMRSVIPQNQFIMR